MKGWEEEVDFLLEFFRDYGEEQPGKFELEEQDPNGRFIIKPKPINLPPPKLINLKIEDEDVDETTELSGSDGEEGGAGIGTGGGDGGGDGPGHGGGVGGTGKKRSEPVPKAQIDMQLSNTRLIKTGDRAVRIMATSNKAGSAVVSLFQVGADNDELLRVVSSETGEVINGKIKIDIQKPGRFSVDVVTSENIVGGLKILELEGSGFKKLKYDAFKSFGYPSFDRFDPELITRAILIT